MFGRTVPGGLLRHVIAGALSHRVSPPPLCGDHLFSHLAPPDLAVAAISVPSLRAGHACAAPHGRVGTCPWFRPGRGRRQAALMVLAAIYGIHYSRARDPDYRSLRSAPSMHPAACRILSRSMAAETINKPNGPGREYQHRFDGNRAEAFPGLSRSSRGWAEPLPGLGPYLDRLRQPRPATAGRSGYLFSS